MEISTKDDVTSLPCIMKRQHGLITTITANVHLILYISSGIKLKSNVKTTTVPQNNFEDS